MSAALLILNAGSSTIKFALYDARTLDLHCRGLIEGQGATTQLKATGALADRFLAAASPTGADHAAHVAWIIAALRDRMADRPLAAVGHRVVHGGARFAAPVCVDAGILDALDGLVPLAPGHQPHNLMAIRAVAAAWPELPQIACFDTAFHQTQDRLARLFPLPRAFADEGILRYGFHGLSYDYIASQLPAVAGPKADGRVIVAHLGNGASLCAMRGRRSIATTMGFTALDGLMMGTRSGTIDPGLVLHLVQEQGAAAVADLLNNRSGLLGVSGISGDVRTLEASDDPRATEALDLFAYRIVRETGSLIAALGGLDVFVFTAGIGENSALVRRKVCAWMRFAGVELDERLNEANAPTISCDASGVAVHVLPTNEELPIAEAARRLIGA